MWCCCTIPPPSVTLSVKTGQSHFVRVIRRGQLLGQRGDGSLAASVVGDRVADDLVDPALQPLLVAQRVDPQVDLEEDLLQDILGARLVGDVPADRAQEPVVEAVPYLFRRRNPGCFRRGRRLQPVCWDGLRRRRFPLIHHGSDTRRGEQLTAPSLTREGFKRVTHG